MPEAGTAAAADSPGVPGSDSAGALAELYARGAHRFDPVRYRFLEILAGHTALHQGEARAVLEARLATALKAFTCAFDAAGFGAVKHMTDMATQFPDAADALEPWVQAGDFAGLRILTARLRNQSQRRPLAELVRQLAGHPLDSRDAAVRVQAPADGPGELKSLTYFRRTWSKLSVDQTLSHSLAQAPENAGPLNSHHLVLRALKLMRDISPEYVSRFMSHADTLLWLDQATSDNAPVKQVVRRETDNKPKARRRKSGPDK